MSNGNFGNFGSWSPKDQALNKMVYDEAHKKGGGPGGGNAGCLSIFMMVVVIILILLTWVII